MHDYDGGKLGEGARSEVIVEKFTETVTKIDWNKLVLLGIGSWFQLHEVVVRPLGLGMCDIFRSPNFFGHSSLLIGTVLLTQWQLTSPFLGLR